jgi:hypothetical protein
MAKKSDDRESCGGSMRIPKEWAVTRVDLDAEEPYCLIDHINFGAPKRKILIPKPLAYYLSTHHCGSDRMHRILTDNAKNSIRDEIKKALLLD